MTYDTPQALRTAIEARIQKTARETGVAPQRLRRRVVFERLMVRLQRGEPGVWVLKGGMALEVRLGDAARLTKDLDLGLRCEPDDVRDLRDRLIELLGDDRDADWFEFTVGDPAQLAPDQVGTPTWRVATQARLAGRQFDALKLDVSPRAHELDATDRVLLPNSLAFAGAETVEVEIIDVHRHAAEKLHAMSRTFSDRENTRVRDIVDLMLLLDVDLLDAAALAAATRQVWNERYSQPPPAALPPLPPSWPERYEQLASEYNVKPRAFADAVKALNTLWAEVSATWV